MLEIHLRLATVLSKLDWSLINQLMFNKATCVGEDSKARQLWKFSRIHKTQHPTTKTSKAMVINLSRRTLDDGVSSLLQKDLNYAGTPRTIPIEDILAGVEKAVQSPAEMEEEARQETVIIVKRSSRPKENITRAERAALRTLKNNTDLTILLADKGNATMILYTVDYRQKITSLLEAPSYRRLARDPTDSTERKTTLLLKRSTLTEDIYKQLRPAGSRPPRLYRLPKIQKEGVPLRPSVSNTGAPTYQLSKYLAGFLNQLTGNLAHHVKNSFQFIQTLKSLRVQPEYNG